MKEYEIPPFSNSQCRDSPTFKFPPLDRSLPEIYDWQYDNSQNHKIFVYTDDAGTPHEIRWLEAVRAIHTAGGIIRQYIGEVLECREDELPVVAILAASDTITYFTTVVGCWRAGLTTFLISPRCSPPAVAHLLRSKDVSHLVVGREPALNALAKASVALLEKKLSSSFMPTFEDLYRPHEGLFKMLPPLRLPPDAPLLILHSSGSTAFPKPIMWTNLAFLLGCLTPCFGEIDLTGKILACHGLPMFHGMSMLLTGWAALCGVIVGAFKPQSPPVVPAPDKVMKGAILTKSDFIFSVPSFLEYWVLFPEYVSHMQSIDGILYGSAPLSRQVGDDLANRGVKIYTMYGVTELGLATKFLPGPMGFDWEYFYLHPKSKSKLIPNGDGYFELAMMACAYQIPPLPNGKVDGEDILYTGDLLEPHPTRPGLWRIFGRADDQIVHSTGEKTNPIPLEKILARDPRIMSAIMFGRGKFNAGVLISPKPDFSFDPSDTTKLVEFRNTIWPTVEEMNEYAPRHSHLFKEMILVENPSKPFTYTGKDTPRRPAILKEYEKEIETLYAGVEESTQANIPSPSRWDVEAIYEFVRAVVFQSIGREINDDDDLFDYGCDSLQATWIRNSLCRGIRDVTKKSLRDVSDLMVYQHPTITELAEYAAKIGSSSSTDRKSNTSISDMQTLVAKYSQKLDNSRSFSSEPLEQLPRVIALTGTTGGMGASLLSVFLKDTTVSKVYALNRSSLTGSTITDRHRKAFKDQNVDFDCIESALSSGRLIFLNASSPTSDNPLGLEESVLDELRATVTHIFHNAWRVDFNMSLSSFEPNIRGVRALIDLALSSRRSFPPSITFSSSIGVLRGSPGQSSEEMSPPELALGSGYTESKWCAEQILSLAAKSTALRCAIVRIGQVCGGGGKNGYWKTSEWLPSLVKSSVVLGALPHLDGVISWLPMDLTVNALRDLAFAPLPSGRPAIFHLRHPIPVPWPTICDRLGSVLNLPVVSYQEWNQKLQSSLPEDDEKKVQAMGMNPALRLLHFFASCTNVTNSRDRSQDFEVLGLSLLSMEESEKASDTLKERQLLRTVGPADVDLWLTYWREQKFIS